MKLTAKHTILASYVGYLTQAITINYAPLLFITFQKEFDISLGKISLLIAISFLTQLTADITEAKLGHLIPPRVATVTAHVCAVLGLTGFAYLPNILPSPYVGLIICTVVAAIGGGIIEVLISPIVEACPTTHKGAAMSLLHSFYSWGFAAVVLLTTLFFKFVGIEHWRMTAIFWALIPAIGAIAFCFVPIYNLDTINESDHNTTQKKKSLFKDPVFILFFIMMLSAGAAEQAMAQWASTFAESGLHVEKSIGDLLGPFAFAVLMGLSRTFYGIRGNRIKLSNFIFLSSILCILSFIITAASPYPLLSLVGCALCGLSVGIMWPGTYSLATSHISDVGVRMFAYLAFAGDIGCLLGPTAAGWIAELLGDDLRISFFVSALFPAVLLICLVFLTKSKSTKYNTRRK